MMAKDLTMLTYGPNVKRLIASRMAAVPAGLQDTLEFVTSKEWVFTVLVNTAPDNPFPDDEVIAGEILRQMDSRRRVFHNSNQVYTKNG